MWIKYNDTEIINRGFLFSLNNNYMHNCYGPGFHVNCSNEGHNLADKFPGHSRDVTNSVTRDSIARVTRPADHRVTKLVTNNVTLTIRMMTWTANIQMHEHEQ